MRSISGDNVDEVVLQLEREHVPQQNEASPGFSFWKLMSEAARAGARAAADEPSDDGGPEGQEDQEEDRVEEDAEDDVARWKAPY
jgi:hypothetical protein